MEMLVVMTIMIILLSVGFTAYASFTETTKYNQDVADLEQDIIIIQRAAMLLERDPQEYWVYGVGIDFGGLSQVPSTGEYRFFKWCSEFEGFGHSWTKGRYPRYDDDDDTVNGQILNTSLMDASTCDATTENRLLPLSTYGTGDLSLQEDVSISSDIRFLLFESVSGRAFLYDTDGNLIDDPTIDLEIHFSKNFGDAKVLQIENLTGRTKVYTPTP